MTRRLRIALNLLRGRFTPFLLPFWDDGERELLTRWAAGESPEEAPSLLAGEIARRAGPGWTAHLVNSGRAAILLALEAAGLPRGSEVLLPSFSCTGVAAPVIQAGLRPVLIDVDEDFNAALESVLEADGPAVKGIIVPHLSGKWASDLEGIAEWARSRGVFVVEDCAQFCGPGRGGRPAGTVGDVGVFSSGPGKPFHGPGGGWLITADRRVRARLEALAPSPEPPGDVGRRIGRFLRLRSDARGAGRAALADALRGRVPLTGGGAGPGTRPFPVFAMSAVEAALALRQVLRTEAIVAGRREHARRWRERLGPPGQRTLRLPRDEDNMYSKMLLSFTGEGAEGESRLLRRRLMSCGVETEASYTPLHLRGPWPGCRRASLEGTALRWRGAFSVPVRPNLGKGDWERIDRALGPASRPGAAGGGG